MSRILGHLTFANVFSTLALFVALGGTSYAAVVINGKSIKNRSIPAVKMKKNSLGGTEIKESKLGAVPNASHASSADSATNAGHARSADSATNAGHATSADSATNAGHATSADSATSAGDLPDLVFENLTLINNWLPYPDTNVPGAALDAQGVVHLRGAMYQITGTNPFPFIMPAKFRPAAQRIYVSVGLLSAKPGRLAIQSDGTVVPESADVFSDAQGFTSLEGATYAVGG
jgi:hypothetical protein